MTSITLQLTRETRDDLVRLLSAGAMLSEGARVVDYLPDNPFGAIDEFCDLVSEPLRLLSPSTREEAIHLTVTSGEAKLLLQVIDGLSESVSGGVPWSALSADERNVVDKCLVRLGHGC